jgi:hypothetical protein
MDSRRFFKPIIMGIFLIAICQLGASVTLAQRGGTAAKGGTFGLERADGSRSTGIKDQPMYYRSVVRALESDFPEIDYLDLKEIYEDANVEGLKFETVVKAFIAAKQRSPESDEDALRKDCINIVNALRGVNKNLSKALRHAFPSLTEKQAKEAERAANTSYKQALREVARRRK